MSMTDLAHCRVTAPRRMTDTELEQEHWDPDTHTPNPYQLILDDGTRLFPSQDPEGNAPGAFLPINTDTVDTVQHNTINRLGGLSDYYMDTFNWDTTLNQRPTIIVFDDDTALVPARDPEGNGPGALFGRETNGEAFLLA